MVLYIPAIVMPSEKQLHFMVLLMFNVCILDYKDSIVMEILMKLLYPRGFAKESYFIKHFLVSEL